MSWMSASTGSVAAACHTGAFLATDVGRVQNNSRQTRSARTHRGLNPARSQAGCGAWLVFVDLDRMIYSVSRSTDHLHSARASKFR